MKEAGNNKPLESRWAILDTTKWLKLYKFYSHIFSMSARKFMWMFVLFGMLFVIANSGCITGYFVLKAEPYCDDPEVASVHGCVGNYLKVVYDNPERGFDLVGPDDSVISCHANMPGPADGECLRYSQEGFCEAEDLCEEQRKCSLSLCDCECYKSGETPEERSGSLCGINCTAKYGINGCEYSGGECVKVYTSESAKPAVEKVIRGSGIYSSRNGGDLTFIGVRQLDCRFCWEYVYSFAADPESGEGPDTYKAIAVFREGEVSPLTINQQTMSCENNVDCRGMGCTHLYPNAKCSDSGECYCRACCQGDSDCDGIDPGYICRENACHPRISPGTLPPQEADCLDRYGEYSEGECILPDGTVCTDEQYFSEGCYEKQLNE